MANLVFLHKSPLHPRSRHHQHAPDVPGAHEALLTAKFLDFWWAMRVGLPGVADMAARLSAAWSNCRNEAARACTSRIMRFVAARSLPYWPGRLRLSALNESGTCEGSLKHVMNDCVHQRPRPAPPRTGEVSRRPCLANKSSGKRSVLGSIRSRRRLDGSCALASRIRRSDARICMRSGTFWRAVDMLARLLWPTVSEREPHCQDGGGSTTRASQRCCRNVAWHPSVGKVVCTILISHSIRW